jgi:3-hydroxyisobutyrate dehydrogenase-like beta-hydroxyacid dehydrogenase
MMIKDLEIALQVARAYKTPLLLTGIGNQLYRAGAGSGYSDKDISSMVKFFGSFAEIDTDKKRK